MSKRESIHIEKTVLSYGLRVWSDLVPWKIREIEGVVNIWEDTQEGYIRLDIDKRYSLDEVIESLNKLAG